jgi:drug/metabolite transporter (DMT)-like permease
VRNIGSLQTILLNVAEIGVTLLLALTWLGERMQPIQWVGVGLLLVSVLLSRWDGDIRDRRYQPLAAPEMLGMLPPFTNPNDPNA